jgi:ribosomal peptide maturation radical SAM protein 1
MSTSRRPAVALVYPPFAPLAPGVGLAILSAGVKRLGFDCGTFYWNIDYIRTISGSTARRRVAKHHTLSYLFPLNEWVFAKQVFPDSDDNDPRILKRLADLDREKEERLRRSRFRSLRDRTRPSRWITELRRTAAAEISQMTDRLAPYDIIGISSTFFQNMAALALARSVKTRWPEKVVVLGGANCDDVMGETLLAQFDFLDYVFSGEVDFSFPEFVRRRSIGAPVDDLPGLIYRDAHGRMTKAPTSVPLEDMNSLPVPDYDDYVASRRSSDVAFLPLSLTLESSRGCWWGAKHHCVFCGLNANGMSFRQKHHERFQREVEQIVERYKPLHLMMTDNIISTSYYKEFVDWARDRRLGIDFFYEIKANLNRAQVDRLADAGITSLQPGIESFSSSVLSLMRKGIHGIQNVAFLKYASDSGVSAFYNVLGGFAGEDPIEYDKMAANVRNLVHLQPPVYGVVAAQYQRFSPMFREAQATLRPAPAYLELYPFSEETIANLAYHFDAREQREHAYFEPLTREIVRWKNEWALRGCTLTWATAGDTVIIRDRRPGFPRRNFRLADHAVPVFHALDKPRKPQAVARELSPTRKVTLTVVQGDDHAQDTGGASSANLHRDSVRHRLRRLLHGVADLRVHEELVSFSRDEFDRGPEAALQPLVEAGVIYVDDGTYLTLPVSDVRRPRRVEWIGNFAGTGLVGWFHRLATTASSFARILKAGA